MILSALIFFAFSCLLLPDQRFFRFFVGFFLIDVSFRKSQYVTFRAQKKATALNDFTTQISCSFFCSDGYDARYLQVNFATKME